MREGKEDGQTVEMALHQINVITALIRQPFNLRGARTEREERQAEGGERETARQGGRKEKESFVCIQMSVCAPPLISSVLSLALMSSQAIVCPGLFKSNTPRGNSWGSQGLLLSHTAKAAPPEPRGPNTSMD